MRMAASCSMRSLPVSSRARLGEPAVGPRRGTFAVSMGGVSVRSGCAPAQRPGLLSRRPARRCLVRDACRRSLGYAHGRRNRSGFEGHTGSVSSLGFSPDGKCLISGSADTTALVWHGATAAEPRPDSDQRIDAKELDALWSDLAGTDAVRAFAAIRKLVGVPRQAVDYLRRHLRPTPVPEPRRLATLVAALADPKFAARQDAEQELEALGELAGAALREALRGDPPLALRQRLERLLDKSSGAIPSGAPIRDLRDRAARANRRRGRSRRPRCHGRRGCRTRARPGLPKQRSPGSPRAPRHAVISIAEPHLDRPGTRGALTMSQNRWIKQATAAWLAIALTGAAAAGDSPGGLGRPARTEPLDVVSMASRIDDLIEAKLTTAAVPSAPLADDAGFFRRISLDLNGRIPTVVQLRDFLDDDRPDKRLRWIDELIDGRNNAALFTRHFTNVWRRTMLWSTPAQPALVGSLEGWLTRQVEANTSYDRVVRAVLTDPEADAFAIANNRMPESLAARTTRLFLGVKLECVQCHDDRVGGSWKRRQFWELAAFFAEPAASPNDAAKPADRSAVGSVPGPAAARIKIGNSDTWVEGRFLDGSRPDWARGESRALLAEWITGPANPWFARAAVNRVWHDFFGSGLIEPVDGLGDAGRPASHPELLDELSRQFAAHGYDLKYLIRAIVASRTYQRTSQQTHAGQSDRRLFARAQVRGLTAEQFFDSLGEATGCALAQIPGADSSASRSDGPQARFLCEFADVHESAAEAQASIPQALMMMNGRLVEEAISLARSRTLATVLSGKAKTAAQAIDELYLAALSRPPRPEERQRLTAFVAGGDRAQTLRDVLWTLLNTTEFAVNH